MVCGQCDVNRDRSNRGYSCVGSDHVGSDCVVSYGVGSDRTSTRIMTFVQNVCICLSILCIL